MNKKSKVTLVIPCLNEEHGLDFLLKQIPSFIDQVLVVDGGSTDKSVKIAKKYGADVIIEPKRGYGLALRRGFNAAKHDVIINFDADGTYPTEILQDFYNFFKKNNFDFLISCRFPLEDKKTMNIKNFFGNLLLSSITSLVFNSHITDVCSGMWVMRKKSWKKIEKKIYDNEWFFSNEIKIEMLKNKFDYGEYHINLKERHGVTKVGNVWAIGLFVLYKTLLKKFY